MNNVINNDYPDFCLRGISNQKWITPEKRIAGLAFEPDDRTVNQNGYQELSISWEKHDQVFTFCKINFKNAFAFGAAKLPRNGLDEIVKQESITNFNYEKNPTSDNPYHGNILFNHRISSYYKRALQGSLAQRSILVS